MLASVQGFAQRFTDELGRGIVAVKADEGVFVSWRITANEYYDVKYNLYRDGEMVNTKPLEVSNFVDTKGTAASTYTVAPIVKGIEGAQSAAARVLSTDYLVIPKATRISNDGKTDITANYSPNDATIGDLDGDGEMEIIVKQNNNVDEAAGFPSSSIDYDRIEVYKLDGTLLWWIDCGPNLADFQHNETNIAVYDWDMDGKAECVMRAADGTKIHAANGEVYTIGDPSKVYRSGYNTSAIFVHDGDEFLVYMNGETGVPYYTGEYPLKRLEAGETNLESAWGDGYGHRSTKHFFGAPYFDGKHPSLFLARGIYTRHKMIAYDINPSTHELTVRWNWTCNTAGSPWYGQGYHNYAVADVDWDGRDEIVFGSMVIDDNGKGLSTTGLGHGDAEHVGDFDPYKHGSEIYACNEDAPDNNYRDATTSKIYYRQISGNDDGRSICGNFTNDVFGAIGKSGHDSFISCVAADHVDGVNGSGVSVNFRIYWDGDLLEESFDGSNGAGSAGCVYKYNVGAIKTFSNTRVNNSTKATPCFQGDIFGDWREEVIMRDVDNNMRIQFTTYPTEWRNYTLLHDHQYRNAMVWQMNGYNQPPHVSYFLGEVEGITIAPPPLTTSGRTHIDAGGSISSLNNDDHILLDETGDASYTISGECAPYILTDNAPSWVQGNDDNDNITYTTYTHTITGDGVLSGSMRLIKQGDGRLVLPKNTHTYTGETNVWAGTLEFDGKLAASPVWLNRFATLESNGGEFVRAVTADFGASISPAGENAEGVINIDTLVLNFGAQLTLDLYADGLTADKIVAKKLVLNALDNDAFPLDDKNPIINLVLHYVAGANSMAAGDYLVGEIGEIEGDLTKVKIDGRDGNKVTLLYTDKKLYLHVDELREASTIYWTGSESNIWDLANTANFVDADGNATVFVKGDKVIFNDDAANVNVKLAEALMPSAVVFSNNKLNYSLSGNSIIGSTSLVKEGNGDLTINNKNQYTGGTTVAGGSLSLTKTAYTSGSDYGNVGGTDASITIKDAKLIANGSLYCSYNIIMAGTNDTIYVGTNSSLSLTDAITAASTAEVHWVKMGNGSLSLANAMNGGILHIKQGTVYAGEYANNLTTPPTVYFEGGTLRDADNIYSYSSCAINAIVAEGTTSYWYLDSRCDYTGSLTGSGKIYMYATSVRNVVNINMSKFTGTLYSGVSKTGSYDPVFIFKNSNGLPQARLNATGTFDNNGTSIKLGNLAGSATMQGSGTYTFGSLNEDVTFSGKFSGSKIKKVGSGVWTTSPQPDVAGDVTVEGGVLNMSGSMTATTKFFGSYNINVYDATLAGVAYINQASIYEGSTLAPGNYTYTSPFEGIVASNIYMYSGSTLRLNMRNGKNTEKSRTYLSLSSHLSLQGVTIELTLSSSYKPAEGDSAVFWNAKLFQASNVTLNLPELPAGLMWDSSDLLTSDGVLRIVKDPDYEEDPTPVNTIVADSKNADLRIFDILGRYVGTDKNALKPGIYIQNGKKILVR